MVTEVGPYKVLELLGTDGIGSVYRVRDTRMAHRVPHADVLDLAGDDLLLA